MRYVFIFVFVIVQTVAFCQSQSDSVLLAYYQKIIKTLADDSMKGRAAGSEQEKTCSRFIAKEFKQQKGAKPKTHKFLFPAPDSSAFIASQNIYCFLNNRKDSTILIGAHYDHIGMGGALSRSFVKNAIHNGADDNASGIALLLGLFNHYNQWKNPNYNYLFVAYSAHEIGLFGSTAFCEFAIKKIPKVVLVLNFDMVGRMDKKEHWLKITATEGNPRLAFFGEKKDSIRFRTESEIFLLQSDAKAFYKEEIPCFSFSTGIHDDYHKVSDDENKINYTGILAIQRLLEQFIGQ